MFGRLVLVLVFARWAAAQSESQGEVKVKEFIGPLTKEVDLGTTAEARAPSTPCSCFEGQCGCCSGMLLEQLGFNVRQRGCMNITYDPDEFAFDMKMSMNDKVLYSNTVSGKNPRPVCIPLPRIRSVKFCVRFSNVYFAGRNVHACINMEGRWQTYTLYDLSFNCVRMGVDGVAVVRPEDGGGLPSVGVGEEEEEEEEGDEDLYEEEEEEEEPAVEDYDDILKEIGDVLDEVDDDDDDDDENENTLANTVSPPLSNVTSPIVANNASPANMTVHHKRRKPTPQRPGPNLASQHSTVLPHPKIISLPPV